MRNVYLFLLICIGFSLKVQSQSTQPEIAPAVVNSSGGSYHHGYYRIDWSIGELALVNRMTNTSRNLVVTNGFLQPFTQEPNKRNDDTRFADDEIIILPNPTSDLLEIDFKTHQQGKVRFALYDVRGYQVYGKEFQSFGYGRIEKINMIKLANGTYFLHILLNADEGFKNKRGTYKILKIQ